MFILEKDSGESKSIEIKNKKRKKNEDVNSCVYALIQVPTMLIEVATLSCLNSPQNAFIISML